MTSGAELSPAARVWTLDVGNSSAKLRCWSLRGAASPRHERAGRELLHSAAVQPRPDEAWCPDASAAASTWSLAEAVERATHLHPPAGGAWLALSCVAARELEQQLVQRLKANFGAHFLGTPDCGLDNLCDPPHGVGRDRLFAARGARELLGRSALVLDAGSALTVDLLVVPSDVGARARFEGGAIAPGPELLARALAQGAARLPAVATSAEAPALGRDTRAAIASGVLHGFRGAARELATRIELEAQCGALPIVLTGGAAPLLLAPGLFGARPVRHEPELVHLGLLHAAWDAACSVS
ncbi:MAG: type III pantothenate kinase [Planctomycetes bacterium]|nr:type III pantothenate kinase [Planctomycetota bacterium]